MKFELLILVVQPKVKLDMFVFHNSMTCLYPYEYVPSISKRDTVIWYKAVIQTLLQRKKYIYKFQGQTNKS